MIRDFKRDLCGKDLNNRKQLQRKEADDTSTSDLLAKCK